MHPAYSVHLDPFKSTFSLNPSNTVFDHGERVRVKVPQKSNGSD